jgi:undecaprenyl diphosphate synthase
LASDAPERGDGGTPRHVAIIMDGNGRWARRRGMPRQAGHRAGVRAARRAVEGCARRGIPVLTVFAFSSENWSRPRKEVGALMKLMVEALDREVGELAEKNVRLRFIGAREGLPAAVQRRMTAAEERTATNTGLTLVVALAYGGRWDLVSAVRSLAAEAAAGKIAPESISEEDVAAHLSLSDLPDADLLIRTGGEFRISNFLLWHLAYSECYFTPALWPDFDEAELDRAIEFFRERERRFGRTPEQVGNG